MQHILKTHGTPEHPNPIYRVNYPLVNTMESRHFVWENSLQMAIFNSYQRVSSRHQFYQDGIFQSSTPRKLRVGGSGWIMFSVSMMGASCMPEDGTPDVMSKTNSNMSLSIMKYKNIHIYIYIYVV